jgi:hypothetical protein
MGTYVLDEDEVADVFEEVNLESHCEGDFYEEGFIKGAKIYLDRLRVKGAFIFSEKADNKGIMCEGCGKAKKKGVCDICLEKKKEILEELENE